MSVKVQIFIVGDGKPGFQEKVKNGFVHRRG
jgi:hypothetical protein